MEVKVYKYRFRTEDYDVGSMLSSPHLWLIKVDPTDTNYSIILTTECVDSWF